MTFISIVTFITMYFYYYQTVYTKKYTNLQKNNHNINIVFCYFLASSYSLFLLDSSSLRLIEKLLILMAISLSIIDVFFFYVDPYLLSLFFCTLLIIKHNFFSASDLNIKLFILVLVSFYLLNTLLPNQLGMGDIKLLICWSLFLSIQQFIWLLFFSSLLGIIYVLSYRLFSNFQIKKIAFVPFLSLGLMIVLTIFN